MAGQSSKSRGYTETIFNISIAERIRDVYICLLMIKATHCHTLYYWCKCIKHSHTRFLIISKCYQACLILHDCTILIVLTLVYVPRLNW